MSESFTGSVKFYKGFYPGNEPESLSSNGAINLSSYLTELSGNLTMTLANGVPNQFKFLNSQGGSNSTITCSLDQSGGAYVGFSLGSNNKALLIWDQDAGYWAILDTKGLTKNL